MASFLFPFLAALLLSTVSAAPSLPPKQLLLAYYSGVAPETVGAGGLNALALAFFSPSALAATPCTPPSFACLAPAAGSGGAKDFSWVLHTVNQTQAGLAANALPGEAPLFLVSFGGASEGGASWDALLSSPASAAAFGANAAALVAALSAAAPGAAFGIDLDIEGTATALPHFGGLVQAYRAAAAYPLFPLQLCALSGLADPGSSDHFKVPLLQQFGPASGGLSHLNLMVDNVDAPCSFYLGLWNASALAFLPLSSRVGGVWGEIYPTWVLHNPGCDTLLPWMRENRVGVGIWQWWTDGYAEVAAVIAAVKNSSSSTVTAAPITFGVEFVTWPLGVCNVLPFATGASWSARNGSAPAVDAAGWPAEDAYTVLFDYAPSGYDVEGFVPNIWGIYKVTWCGGGDVTLYPGIGLVLNTTLDPTTFTSTAFVSLQQAQATTPGLVIGVFNSQRTPGAPLNSGFTNLRVLQPACVGGEEAPFFAPFALAALAPFAHARLHEWFGTNTIPVHYPATASWGDRRALTDVFYGPTPGSKPKAVGAPWETALLLASQSAAAATSLWINVPVYADTGYVAALADLLVGAGSGTLPPLSCPYLFLEHGNELWLNSSNAPLNYAYNMNASIAEVAAGGSVLNNDGERSPKVWAIRRHLKRLREIAGTFRAAAAGAALQRQGSSPTPALRPVLAWMQDYSGQARDAFAWLERTYGAGEAARAFFGYAVNSYHGAGVYPSGTPPLPDAAQPADVLASMLETSDASLPARLASAAVAQDFGLQLVSYEGSGWAEPNGAHFNSVGFNATLGAIIDFNRRSPGAAEQQAYDVKATWGAVPGGLSVYNFYALSGGYGEAYGACLGLTEDLTNSTASPKYAGALKLMSEAK